jgi:hypothetical protein
MERCFGPRATLLKWLGILRAVQGMTTRTKRLAYTFLRDFPVDHDVFVALLGMTGGVYAYVKLGLEMRASVPRGLGTETQVKKAAAPLRALLASLGCRPRVYGDELPVWGRCTVVAWDAEAFARRGAPEADGQAWTLGGWRLEGERGLAHGSPFVVSCKARGVRLVGCVCQPAHLGAAVARSELATSVLPTVEGDAWWPLLAHVRIITLELDPPSPPQPPGSGPRFICSLAQGSSGCKPCPRAST